MRARRRSAVPSAAAGGTAPRQACRRCVCAPLSPAPVRRPRLAAPAAATRRVGSSQARLRLRAGDRIMEHERIRDDLRERVSLALLRTADGVAQDALAAFIQLTIDDRDREYVSRLLDQLLRLLAYAIDDNGLAGRTGELTQLSCTLDEKRFPVRQLFSLVLSLERAALDELAVDDNMGATSEGWGTVAQLIRAGSFEVLAAHADRSRGATAGITDPLTGARSRAFFDAVLAVECDRAHRFGDHLALIAVRLDHSANAEERLGTGVAEKMLRRIGIVARGFFRQQDLVARLAGEAIAVLLVRSDAE